VKCGENVTKYDVEQIRQHDSEYIDPLPERTNHHVNGMAVQGRRDMIRHFDSLLSHNKTLRETLLDASHRVRWVMQSLVSYDRGVIEAECDRWESIAREASAQSKETV
jgi:hypothetical protein